MSTRKHDRKIIQECIRGFFPASDIETPKIPYGVDVDRFQELIGEKIHTPSSIGVKLSNILETMASEGFDITEVYAEIYLLKRRGDIMETGCGVIKWIY